MLVHSDHWSVEYYLWWQPEASQDTPYHKRVFKNAKIKNLLKELSSIREMLSHLDRVGPGDDRARDHRSFSSVPGTRRTASPPDFTRTATPPPENPLRREGMQHLASLTVTTLTLTCLSLAPVEPACLLRCGTNDER